jgi:hypothetical protein
MMEKKHLLKWDITNSWFRSRELSQCWCELLIDRLVEWAASDWVIWTSHHTYTIWYIIIYINDSMLYTCCVRIIIYRNMRWIEEMRHGISIPPANELCRFFSWISLCCANILARLLELLLSERKDGNSLSSSWKDRWS